MLRVKFFEDVRLERRVRTNGFDYLFAFLVGRCLNKVRDRRRVQAP